MQTNKWGMTESTARVWLAQAPPNKDIIFQAEQILLYSDTCTCMYWLAEQIRYLMIDDCFHCMCKFGLIIILSE